MKKLILSEQGFHVQNIPLEESPDRVTIKHNATRISATADTREEAWASLLEKLSAHYRMQVVVKANVD